MFDRLMNQAKAIRRKPTRCPTDFMEFMIKIVILGESLTPETVTVNITLFEIR